MAKCVGAPSDYYYHGPFGYLNYVLPIGRGKCNNPFFGCNANNPAVGPDDQRTGFGNHAYTKLGGTNNYDACMRRWVPWWMRIILIFIRIWPFQIPFIVIKWLQIDDWLIDLPQPTYNSWTIDTSQPFEAAAAGGVPALIQLQFQIV